MPSERPFAAAPAYDGGNFLAWFTTLPGIYTWVPAMGPLRAKDAAALIDRFDIATLDYQFPNVERFSFFHDWSNGKGYEPKFRGTMVQWAKSIPKDRMGRIVVRLSDDAAALDRMALASASAALAIVGRYIDIVDDVGGAIDRDIRSVRPRQR